MRGRGGAGGQLAEEDKKARGEAAARLPRGDQTGKERLEERIRGEEGSAEEYRPKTTIALTQYTPPHFMPPADQGPPPSMAPPPMPPSAHHDGGDGADRRAIRLRRKQAVE